ncbi:MAG: hypothetical protein IKO42_03445, partial [Opitutales bacterium]|nr:hypothetical protein [Opitutales bacterium]
MKTFAGFLRAAAPLFAAAFCACSSLPENKIPAAAELMLPIEAGVVLPKEPAELSAQIKNAMFLAAEEHNARQEASSSKINLFFVETDGSKEQFETALAVLKARR